MRRFSGHQSLIYRRGKLIFRPGSADKKLLPRSCAQRNRLPAILRRYRDSDLDFALGVSHRTDHSGNNRPNLWTRAQQPFQHIADPVDNTVLDLELSLRGTLSERWH